MTPQDKSRKFRIDRRDLPYDAFVANPAALGPIEPEDPQEKGGVNADEQIQAPE